MTQGNFDDLVKVKITKLSLFQIFSPKQIKLEIEGKLSVNKCYLILLVN